jgi:hypothetical protein
MLNHARAVAMAKKKGTAVPQMAYQSGVGVPQAPAALIMGNNPPAGEYASGMLSWFFISMKKIKSSQKYDSLQCARAPWVTACAWCIYVSMCIQCSVCIHNKQ